VGSCGVGLAKDWLCATGIAGRGQARYGDLFAHHGLGLDVLEELAKDDLESIGVPLGDRRG
jgi:hypothetical protein